MMRLSLNYNLIMLSYIFEAYLFEYESQKNKMDIIRIRFVSITSIILGILASYNIIYNT